MSLFEVPKPAVRHPVYVDLRHVVRLEADGEKQDRTKVYLADGHYVISSMPVGELATTINAAMRDER